MLLSYSFSTRITSGYLKGTQMARLDVIMDQFSQCATPTCHPLLLLVIILTREISAENDVRQRNARDRIRGLEHALAGRYKAPSAEDYVETTELTLDTIKGILVDSRSEILWKRPQAWQNAVKRAREAGELFWEKLSEERKVPNLRRVHRNLMSRLDFISTKLECLEHYAHVSLERLDIQREEVPTTYICGFRIL